MNKLNVAILTGGNVAERGISLKSAKTIYKHLDDTKYNKFIIELNGTSFSEQSSGAVLDKNDFTFEQEGRKITFDLVYMMLHGHPAEDGSIQGYFDLLQIPYTGCDHFVSALTFNKQACKDFLHSHNVPMAPSKILYKGKKINWDSLLEMGLPLFVKPNKNGSSYGVSKVNKPEELTAAIDLSFQYDDEVIVEGFLDGVEYSTGVLNKNGTTVVLPVTEICPENDFFDYKAKYENQSQEITPARLSKELTKQCQQQTKALYEIFNCKGICRMDYILVDGTFYFLEANTIPGMSEQSIVPQQTIAHGWTITELLDCVVEEALKSNSLSVS